MNRREVLQKFLLGGTVLVMAPSLLESCSKSQDSPVDPQSGNEITIDLTLPANSALNTTGGSKIVQDVLVVNTGSGSYVALSSICTHQGCTVAYDQSAGKVKCPCHGSVFSTTGSVVNGPASSPLQGYPVNKSGNILTISL